MLQPSGRGGAQLNAIGSPLLSELLRERVVAMATMVAVAAAVAMMPVGVRG